MAALKYIGTIESDEEINGYESEGSSENVEEVRLCTFIVFHGIFLTYE